MNIDSMRRGKLVGRRPHLRRRAPNKTGFDRAVRHHQLVERADCRDARSTVLRRRARCALGVAARGSGPLCPTSVSAATATATAIAAASAVASV
jgi:hypothetical protein